MFSPCEVLLHMIMMVYTHMAHDWRGIDAHGLSDILVILSEIYVWYVSNSSHL